MTKSMNALETSSAAKQARLEARVTAERKRILERAAGLEGRTLSEFIVTSSYEAAMKIIVEREQLHLNVQDSARFVDALLSNNEPGSKLRDAAARYKRNKRD